MSIKSTLLLLLPSLLTACTGATFPGESKSIDKYPLLVNENRFEQAAEQDSILDANTILVNGLKITDITSSELVEKLEYERVSDSEGSVYFQKGDSYFQFYETEVTFINVMDSSIVFKNPDLIVGGSINESKDVSLLLNNKRFKTQLLGENCEGISISDNMDNLITIYIEQNRIMAITFSAVDDY